ncbi:MAG: 30S ribosomal protein S20 [Verrucomicrobia bacterium]|nr:30S ribosomal protein S20 [Verrucomicrobiota bacterium]
MANIASAAKRARQATRITERNRALKTQVKTIRKQVITAIEAKDKTAATTSLNSFKSMVDKASKTNVIHRNAAARTKSSLAKQVSAI